MVADMMRSVLGALGVTALLLLPGVGAADEAKTPITPMILNLMAPPQPSSNALLSEAMRAPGPRARNVGPLAGEIQPDGSVRYGDVSVTIKNPCPEGTAHYEPPPLPGRRARR